MAVPNAQQQAPASALSMQDYMAQYGQRLQSLLTGGMSPQQARMASPVPMSPQPSALGGPPQQAPAPGQPGPPAAPGGGGGSSFQSKWTDSSQEEKQQATDDLEKQLKAGNQTIDSAYDNMVKQLGERPADDHKLSREDKGMLLMEFGLSLMQNSSSQGFGEDVGGAIGASGLSALQGHRERRGRARERYDDQRSAIEGSRAQSKSRLAEQGMLEARAEARDDRRSARESSQLAGVVTGADDMAYGYTRGGGISKLEQPGGQGVKVKPKPLPAGPGGGRGYESERRYSQYMEIYGKDEAGKPLEGADLKAVEKRALAFSADPKASTTSDAEMRAMAERSADNFQRSNWAQFRDMQPDQIQAWRNKNAEENFQRLKRGEDMSTTPPSQRAPKPTSALASKPQTFKSMDEIRAALKAKNIKLGDTVMLNGKSFTLKPKAAAP